MRYEFPNQEGPLDVAWIEPLRMIERVLAQPGATVADSFFDLDDFGDVNDALGHVAGDELAAAPRLDCAVHADLPLLYHELRVTARRRDAGELHERAQRHGTAYSDVVHVDVRGGAGCSRAGRPRPAAQPLRRIGMMR